MSLGLPEILLIVFVVLILFGAGRIPELARSLGRASYEFKKAKRELSDEAGELFKEAEKNAEAKDAAAPQDDHKA